ncbi:hypothetical protein SERLADRAFT_441205 [Serpula lacrymans var. lacrymans S7.9]|uniref:Uncharacterized protein n=1 Tax=Serpula lacrymans var. lacrymans (strain S7.9) TaxID=578457 RepID=F8P5U5_SERL9|nr:uncharacterized protein SERLADRAFT_441205 [Serpula lacrymans var. lacrymans S7.9]EGO21982.1 hypothetical protein SERLADRAFT_441205 [Serpula lacrymans var. lacrymans S7.9]
MAFFATGRFRSPPQRSYTEYSPRTSSNDYATSQSNKAPLFAGPHVKPRSNLNGAAFNHSSSSPSPIDSKLHITKLHPRKLLQRSSSSPAPLPPTVSPTAARAVVPQSNPPELEETISTTINYKVCNDIIAAILGKAKRKDRQEFTYESDLDRNYIIAEINKIDHPPTHVTCFSDLKKMIITVPSDVHEAPLNSISHALSRAIDSIGHDPFDVQVFVTPNTQFKGPTISGYPDLHVRIETPMTHSAPRTVWITECGFTQSRNDIIRKFERYIRDCPSLVALTLIDIQEDRPFSNPRNNQPIAHQLRSQPVLSYEHWAPDTPREDSFHPIVYFGHTFISVSGITVCTWIRGPGGRISLEDFSKELYAEGTLHPRMRTKAINAILQSALKLVRDSIVDVIVTNDLATEDNAESNTGDSSSEESSVGDSNNGENTSDRSEGSSGSTGEEVVESNEDAEGSDDSESGEEGGEGNDLSEICSWTPPSRVIRWEIVKCAVISGIWNTAYNHYQDWHETLHDRFPQDDNFNASKKPRPSGPDPEGSMIYDKLRLHAEIRFPIKKVQKTSDNIFLWIQAILGGIPLGGGDSQSHYEVSTVFHHISRIATAVVEVAIVKKSGAQAKHGLELSVDHLIFVLVLLTITQVLKVLAQHGISTFNDLLRQDPMRIDILLNRRAPCGFEVLASARQLPKYYVRVTKTNVTPSNGKDPVEIKLSIQCTKALGEPKTFPINAQLTKPDQLIFVYVSPDKIAGLTIAQIYKPKLQAHQYPTLDTRPPSSLEMDLAGLEDDPDFWNMDFADEDEETVFVKDPTKTLETKATRESEKLHFAVGRWTCRYHCLDANISARTNRHAAIFAAEKDYLSLLKCLKSDFSQTPSTPRNITRTLDLRPKERQGMLDDVPKVKRNKTTNGSDSALNTLHKGVGTERNQKPPEGHRLKLANISSGDVSQQKTRVTPNFDLEFIHATRQIKKSISISSETSYSSSETDSLIRNLPLEFFEPSISHYQRTMSQKAGHHRDNSGSPINGRYEAANECPPTKKPRFDVGGGYRLVTPSGLLDEKKTGFSGSPAKVQTEERQSLSDISEQDDTVDEDTPRGYTLENAAREQATDTKATLTFCELLRV